MKNYLKNLSLIKWFLDIRKELSLIRFQTTRQTKLQQQIYKEILKANKRNYRSKIFPIDFEHQTFSQNGEDGILQEIFNRLKIENGTFVEIGIGDGSENNTRLLLENGWTGTWVDGGTKSCEIAKKTFESHIKNRSLVIKNTYVSEKNVNDLLNNLSIPKEVDLLSLDIDLTTHLVWRNLKFIQPKVCVIEYNGFFPEGINWEAKIRGNSFWDGSINMGASLKSIIEIGEEKGYKFIGCDLSGTNAFFVINSHQHLFSDLPHTRDYEPAKPYLVNSPDHLRD